MESRDRNLCLLCVMMMMCWMDDSRIARETEKRRGRDENCKGKRKWCRALVESELTSEGASCFWRDLPKKKKKRGREGRERGKKGKREGEGRKGKGATTRGITRVKEGKR